MDCSRSRARRIRRLVALDACEPRTLVSESLGWLGFSLAHAIAQAGVTKSAGADEVLEKKSALPANVMLRDHGFEFDSEPELAPAKPNSRSTAPATPIPSRSVAYARSGASDSGVHSIFDADGTPKAASSEFATSIDSHSVGASSQNSAAQPNGAPAPNSSPPAKSHTPRPAFSSANDSSTSNGSSSGGGVISAVPSSSAPLGVSSPKPPSPTPTGGPYHTGGVITNGPGAGGTLPHGVWQNPSGVEGQALASPLVSYTLADLQNGGPLANYAATIIWGDGGTTAGALSQDASHHLLISGPHTFVERGSYSATVDVTGPSGAHVTDQGPIVMADAPIASAGSTVAPTAGNVFAGQVAVINDSNPYGVAADYSASIDWGNGQTTSGTIGGSNGHLTVSGSTTYNTSGLDRITVSVTDTAGLTTTAHAAANVSDAAITISTLSLSADEGVAFNGVVGSFTSSNSSASDSTFSAVITWGDGKITAGSVAPNGGSGFNVSGSNTFTSPGTYTYSLRITSRGGKVASTSGSVSVAQGTLTGGSPILVKAVEGELFSGPVGRFKDSISASVDTYTAEIGWGDGSSSAGTVVPAAAGIYQVWGSHTYHEEGSYIATLVLSRPHRLTTTSHPSVVVADALLTADGEISSGELELSTAVGTPFSGEVARFTDASVFGEVGDFTSTVYWGDGTSSTGSISMRTDGVYDGVFHVTASHTYSTVGKFSVGTFILDEGGSSVGCHRVMDVAGPPLTISPVSFSPTEGAVFQGAVAILTGGDPNAAPGDYSATVDWGDGITSSGQISARTAGGFMVSGAHAYLDEGRYPVQITLLTPNGTTLSALDPTHVADASLSATGLSINAVEGETFAGVVATLTDANVFESGADLSATINWGDGQTSAGAVILTGRGAFTVVGSNVYAAAGSYLITVHVVDRGGSSATALGYADVIDTPIEATAVPISASAGSQFTGTVATFTEGPGDTSASAFYATIYWGDGPFSAGTITANSGAGDPFLVSGSHTYQFAGDYVARVVISNINGNTTAVFPIATVSGSSASGFTVECAEGLAFSGQVAILAAPSPGDQLSGLTATISWGDGTSSTGTIFPDAGGVLFAISGTHTYQEDGNYGILVALRDTSNASVVQSAAAIVLDAPVHSTASSLSTALGQTLSGTVAHLTDDNPYSTADDFAATITWGDGATSSGAVTADPQGGFVVSGSHTYTRMPAGGSSSWFLAGVQVWDDGGSKTSTSMQVFVSDSISVAGGINVAAVEGVAFNAALATFSDANPYGQSTDFLAKVAWGDGQTSSGAIVPSAGGGFTVYGTHEYIRPGSYPTTVKITGAAGLSSSVQSTVTVAQAKPAGSGVSVSATSGIGFDGPVVTFTAGPSAAPSSFAAVIDWGDGSPSSLGEISAPSSPGGHFVVTGSHSYASHGAYAIHATVRSSDGSTTAADTIARVVVPPSFGSNPLPGGGSGSDGGASDALHGVAGSSFSGSVAAFATLGSPINHFSATIEWGDGTSSSGAVAGADQGAQVSGSHTYKHAGTYLITTHVKYDGVVSEDLIATIVVSEPALTVASTSFDAAPLTPSTNVAATFTDPNAFASASDFQATIDWGDFSRPTTGTVAWNPLGYFEVRGTHTYQTESVAGRPVAVTITDKDGDVSKASSTAYVIDPPMNGAGAQVFLSPGEAFLGTIATITQGDVSVYVNWNDGDDIQSHKPVYVVPNVAGGFNVVAQHVFDAPGTYRVGVRVQGNSVGPDYYYDVFATFIVSGQVAGLHAHGESMELPLWEELPDGVPGDVATIDSYDWTQTASLAASIDWGDGATTVVNVYATFGHGTVAGGHTYWNAGSYDVSVTIFALDAGGDVIDTTQVDTTITLDEVADGRQLDPTEIIPIGLYSRSAGNLLHAGADGQVSGTLGYVTDMYPDADSSDYVAGISWGDGTWSPATVSGAAISGSHTYLRPGIGVITVGISRVITDMRTTPPFFDMPTHTWIPGLTIPLDIVQSTGFECQVVVAEPTLTPEPQNLTLGYGSIVSGPIAQFSVGGPAFDAGVLNATIDWGDGTTTPGTIVAASSGFSVEGIHLYDSPGDFIPYVKLQYLNSSENQSYLFWNYRFFDDNSWEIASQIHVTPNESASAEAEPHEIAISGQTGQQLSDVEVGVITESRPRSWAGVSIDWGDGSTTGGAIRYLGNSEYGVFGDHRYATSGVLRTHVKALGLDSLGSDQTFGVATISGFSRQLSAAGVQIVAGGGGFVGGTVVATFTDPLGDEQPSQYSAMVSFGDTVVFPGVVSAFDGYLVVTTSMTEVYAANLAYNSNTMAIVVDVQSRDGGEAQVASTVSLSPGVEGVGSSIGWPFYDNWSGLRGPGSPPTEMWQYGETLDSPTSGANLGVGLNVWDSDGQLDQASITVFRAPLSSRAWLVPASPTDIPVPYSVQPAAVGFGSAPMNGPNLAGIDGVPVGGPLATILTLPGSASASDFNVMVDWGDGTVSAGSISDGGNSTFLVYGDHTYAAAGSFTATIMLEQSSGNHYLSSASVLVAPRLVSGSNISANVHTLTGNVTVATIDDPAVHTDSLKVTIDWGDQSTSAGAIVANEDGTFCVVGDHTYGALGDYGVTVYFSSTAGRRTSYFVTATATVVNSWTISGSTRREGYTSSDDVGLGEASVALNTGALSVSHALDFDQSPGTSVGGAPALIYNSNTVAARPIIEASIKGDPNGPAPTSIEAQLTWDLPSDIDIAPKVPHPAPQVWVTFSTANHNAADAYGLAVQVADAVTRSDHYYWRLDVRLVFGDGDPVNLEIDGTTDVVVSDSKTTGAVDSFGPGWALQGLDQLVFTTGGTHTTADGWESGGIFMVDSSGSSRFFAQTRDGKFVSPTDDFGVLTEEPDETFIYTAKGGAQEFFDVYGRLSSVLDTDSQSIVYHYDFSGLLTQVTAPDGGVTTLHYAGGLLSSIHEPGGREVALSRDGAGDLTQIVDANGSTRSFAYDSAHRLTSDDWGPLDASFTYDPTSGAVTSVNEGLGTAYQIGAASVQALSTGVSSTPGNLVATVVDALSHTTSYTLDDGGRLLKKASPGGRTEKWTYDEHGAVTSQTDPLGRATKYYLDDSSTGKDDVLEVDYADGSFTRFEYDPVYHKVSRQADALGDVTRFIIDPKTGHVVETIDADGDVTTESWSNGLLLGATESHAVTDTSNHTTTYEYDSKRRLIETTDPDGNSTSTTYDANGNPATETDARGKIINTQFNALNQLVSRTEPGVSSPTTTQYDAIGNVTRVTDPRGIVTLSTYDQRGLLVSTTVASGTPAAATTSFTYDAAKNVVSETDPAGIETQYTYDADGRRITEIDGANSTTPETTRTVYDANSSITDTIDPRNIDTHSTYDAMGRVLATTRAYGSAEAATTVDEYDAVGRLVAQTDPKGIKSNTTYDAAGRVVSSTEAANSDAPVTTTHLYNPAGTLASTTDAKGEVFAYVYNGDDELISERDDATAPHPLNSSTQYDGDGNVVRATDTGGVVTTYSYDDRDQLQSMTVGAGSPDAETSTYLHDDDGNLVLETDPRGIVTKYTYDDLNRLVSTIEGFGTQAARTATTTYDADGDVTDTLDFAGIRTHNTFDAFGDLLTATVGFGAAGASTTAYTYDDDRNLATATDAIGVKTAFLFDALNRRITTTVDSTGAHPRVSHTVYDADDEVTDSEDPTGIWTHNVFDQLGDLLSSTLAYGTSGAETTSYTYNSIGDRLTTTDAMANVTTYQYNDAEELVGTLGPATDLTTETYDDDGRVLTSTDPMGLTTSYTYDDFGRQLTATDPMGHVTRKTYDEDGNVVTFTDPDNNTTLFTYDALGNRLSMTDPLGHSASRLYNADGQVLTQTDRDGRVQNFAYNGLGELITHTQYNAAGQLADVATFTYDDDGNTLTASNYAGTYTFSYDDEGEVDSQTDPNGITLTYTRDDDGRVTLVSDSLGGQIASVYNSDGGLTTRTLTASGGPTLTANFTYNADNLPLTLTRTSGATVATTQYTYDADSRLTQLAHNGPSGSIESFAYSYDAGSRLTSVSNTKSGGTTVTPYSYDGASQLTSAGSSSYAYDANGNRTAGTTIGPGNRLASDGTWNYSYDAEGNRIGQTNITNGETWTFNYDDDNRLLTAVRRDHLGNLLETVDYGYDVFGDRVEEDVIIPGAGTTTQRFAYGEDGTLWADMNGTGALQTRYLNGDAVDEVLARESAGGAVAWYLTDDEGSVRDLVNNSGAVIDQIAYDAFGNVTAESAPTAGDRFKYTGSQYDAAVGLYYNVNRYYDPRTGVWTTQDPSGFGAGDANLYRYVGNAPTNATDPTGLWSLSGTLSSAWNSVSSTSAYVANHASTVTTAARTVVAATTQRAAAQVGQVADAAAAAVSHTTKAVGTFIDENPYAAGTVGFVKGLGQGVANTANGVQDGLAGIGNLGIAAYNGVGNATEYVSGTNYLGKAGYIEVADWSKGLVVDEDPALHDLSKFLGGSGAIDLASGGLGKIGLVNKAFCGLEKAVQGSRLLSKAAEAASVAGKVVSVGSGIKGTADSTIDMFDAIQKQDYARATKDLYTASTTLLSTIIGLRQSCFAAGTPLLTPDGQKPIEQFRPGDLILSAPENDPTAPPSTKRVLRVFENVAPLIELAVGGQVIRTTSEHPFWVEGRGWTATRELMEGDRLRGHHGSLVALTGTAMLTESAPVYNLEVADYHTYFVGTRRWAFSVWAHNLGGFNCGDRASRRAAQDDLLEQNGMKEVPAPTGRGTQNPAVRDAVEKGDIAHAVLQDKMRNKGWLVDRADTGVIDPATGREVYPDAITLRGRPVEIKPRTPTGIHAGDSQLSVYERATGKGGRVVYYDPNEL
jgi:RHS repeat-associated protein